MYSDEYYPDHVVDKGKAILLRLYERIETEHPGDLPALYALTNAATGISGSLPWHTASPTRMGRS
jgi:hypothetical protein